jgi:hypothetical protein
MIRVVHPGFYPSRSQGSKRHRIRNTGTLVNRIFCLPCPCSTHCADATEAMRERDGYIYLLTLMRIRKFILLRFRIPLLMKVVQICV